MKTLEHTTQRFVATLNFDGLWEGGSFCIFQFVQQEPAETTQLAVLHEGTGIMRYEKSWAVFLSIPVDTPG